MNISRQNKITAFQILLISALGILIYSNTLSSSFQFDDKLNIVDNLMIRDIRNLWPPSGPRWFGLLTFSLNYTFGGLNPFGYHLVNLCIHILAAVAVYVLVLQTCNTPFMTSCNNNSVCKCWFAFACSVLFIVHPVQTQAVTYIVQRLASLAALLFLISLNTYIAARRMRVAGNNLAAIDTRNTLWIRVFLYCLAGFTALLAAKTKENAITLPVIICLYEIMFLSSLSGLLSRAKSQWRLVSAITGLVTIFIVSAVHMNSLHKLFDGFRATNEITRHDYMITQFRVIATYLRLLFLPINQTLDYHYKVYSNIFTPEIIASAMLIALLLIFAAYLYRVSSACSRYLRLISFGIFWFFITLSVESSFIPIIDVIFEHRLYLPIVGAIISVSAACLYLLENVSFLRKYTTRLAAYLLAAIVAALSVTTYVRNNVWRTELSLWSDVIAKTPDNPRGYNMIGNYFLANFRVYDAIAYFQKALEVDRSYAEARSNLGNAFIQIGKLDEGLKELMLTANTNRFDAIDTGILYYNIGRAYHLKGASDLAIQYLNMAVRFIPNETSVYYLLGEVYTRKNLPEQGAVYLKKAHEMDPTKY